jgi:hypothetical protein
MTDLAQRWQAYYDRHVERGEMGHLMTRAEADAYAFAACVVQWRDTTLQVTKPGICAYCGNDDAPHTIVPYGRKAWVHVQCWPAWYAARGAHADAELSGMIKRIA